MATPKITKPKSLSSGAMPFIPEGATPVGAKPPSSFQPIASRGVKGATPFIPESSLPVGSKPRPKLGTPPAKMPGAPSPRGKKAPGNVFGPIVPKKVAVPKVSAPRPRAQVTTPRTKQRMTPATKRLVTPLPMPPKRRAPNGPRAV